MFKSLLRFEWHYQKSKPLFYAVPALFLGCGVLIGSSSGITFPNMFANSPYQISYLATILSLAGILVATIFVAQSVLREDESNFAGIIYTTPANKAAYMLTRFVSLWGICSLSMILAMVGIFLGQQASTLPADKFGPFSLLTYLTPFVVFIIPNICLCVALLCSSAWLSRSKLMVFITGLLIYILYIAGSIFSNSPLIAGSAPADPDQVSLLAKLDPFGIAAFFEQTRYWSAEQRNTLQISLTGNMLVNRALWLSISFLSITISVNGFATARTSKKRKSERPQATTRQAEAATRPIKVTPSYANTYFLQNFYSFMKIDLLNIVKGIPFLIILISIGWLLCIEFSNAVNGNLRSGESYATSSLMFNTIKDVLPSFSLLVLLFFSSEVIWKSRDSGFYHIERSSPYRHLARKFATICSLTTIAFMLIMMSIVLAIVFQLYKGYPIDIAVYGSLFFYLGLPLFVNCLLMVAIHQVIPSKYPALAVSTLIILLGSTSIGNMVGLNYPMLRFGFSIPAIYSDMNGYGGYKKAFFIQMAYCCSFGLLLLAVDRDIWRNLQKRSGPALFVSVLVPIFLSSTGFIVYHASINRQYQTQNSVDDWKTAYELKYKRFENLQQPTITSVKTEINLYPSKLSYYVTSEYVLQNRTKAPIDSILVYMDPETTITKMAVSNAKLIASDEKFGHRWFVLDQPLSPGSSTVMTFSFHSGWVGIKPHTAFNSIIPNGSFLRISTFFPRLGYDSGNELSSEIKRSQRGLARQRPLKKLEQPTDPNYDYQFIDYEAIISTERSQIAVSSGALKKQWKKGGRNYFHFKSDRAMPFRFAVSSAEYKISKSYYRTIPIEIYYHPSHSQNVKQLMTEAKRTLAYAEKSFGRFPHRIMRFAEVSAFAEGFAATSYPNVIYMKENGGFFNNIEALEKQDEINKLAGHELSHQWWGGTGLNPEYKEGSWVLTETLAKYTELMLYRQTAGRKAELETVRMHLDLYLSQRSYSSETSLYKTTFDTPHIPYDKGMVVMHQIEQLVGEDAVNSSLRALYYKHRFPFSPPTSNDLIFELLAHTHSKYAKKIEELFKEIITYDARVIDVKVTAKTVGFNISLTAEMRKFKENGKGKQSELQPENTIQVGVEDINGKLTVYSCRVSNKKVFSMLTTLTRPTRIILDPNIRNIDISPLDNQREIKL